jgi:hypothetical protein
LSPEKPEFLAADASVATVPPVTGNEETRKREHYLYNSLSSTAQVKALHRDTLARQPAMRKITTVHIARSEVRLL